MIRSEKWWLGILPVAALGFAANYFNQTDIERDLGERSAIEASAQNLQTSVSGRDIVLSGLAFDKSDVDALVKKTDAIWGVRKVIDKTEQPPATKPFIWEIQNDGKAVTLLGHVPSPAFKTRLLANLKEFFGSKEINDTTTFANGKPEGFENTTTLVAKQLALLEEGTASFSDNDISIKGRAKSLEEKEAILKALKTLPAGMKLANIDISVPEPFSFEAIKTDGQVTLKGSVPDEKSKLSLLDSAKQFFFKDKVVDELAIDANAPKNFMSVAMGGLKALSRLGNGSFSFENKGAKIAGSALYEKAIDGIQADLKGLLPEGVPFDFAALKANPRGEGIDGATCQVSVNQLLGSTRIRFETNQALISPYSAGLLDHIVATLVRCPDAKVEIVGHTDSTGDDNFNQSLSEKRAEAVLNYLSHAGLTTEHFAIIGKGATQPIATNDTEEGKAQNRRIDFIVE